MEGQDYKIPLGFDISKAIKDIQTVKTNLSALGKEAQTVGNNINRAFNNATSASGRFASSVTNSANNLKNATDQANRFNGSLQNINNSVNTVNANPINVNTRGLTEANRVGGGFAGTLLRIGGLIGTVFGVTQIANFASELVDLAMKGEGVTRAFDKIEGGATKNLEALRTAVKGTVSDLTLMQVAVRADNFKIPMDALAKGLAFARQRAVDTGQSVDYLVNSFVDGIGRKSTLVLDNLGISASELQEEVRRVGDFAEATGNIIERSMSDSSTSVDDFGSRVRRLATYWDNAKLAMSRFTGDLLTEIGDIVASDTWKEFFRRIGSFGDGRYITQAKNLAKVYKEVSDALGSSMSSTSDLEIIRRVNSGEDFKKISSQAENMYKDMQKAREEYEYQVKENNIREDKTTVEHYRQMEKRAKENAEVIRRVGKQFNLNAPKLGFTVDTESIEVLEDRLEKLVNDRKTQTNLAEVDRINKEVKAVEKQIDRLKGKEDKESKRRSSDAEKLQRKQEQAQQKALDRQNKVDAERVRIENETLKNQVDLIEDKVTQSVAKETTESQARVRLLEQRKKDFPELVKEINQLIESEEVASQARVTAIIKKGQEEDEKAVKKSQEAIRKALKTEYQARVDDIEASYQEIIDEAIKTGTYTKDIEVQLEKQKQKELESVRVNSRLQSLEREEQLSLNTIFQIKRKEGESLERFERENQRKVLEVFVEFAEKKIELMKSDPTKIGEVNDLLDAVRRAKEEIKGIETDQQEDLFEWMGLDDEKIKKWSDRISKFGEVFSDLFSGIADGARAKVDQIQEEISAIDELISKQEQAVDKERELMDKGLANNYENAQAELELQKQNREQLIRQEEEAKKRVEQLQKAQLVADSVSQASNLVTASTEIFKTFSKIPFVGIPLAIAMIGTMFGAFAIAKVNAIKNTKFEKGGLIGGKSHAEGGNKFVSVDGSMIEHEKGEFVINKQSTVKYRNIIEAINKDDFRNVSMNDISLKALLDGTGVTTSSEVAKLTGENSIVLFNESKNIEKTEVLNISELSETLKKIYKDQKDKTEVIDFGSYIEIRKGNKTQRFKK